MNFWRDFCILSLTVSLICPKRYGNGPFYFFHLNFSTTFLESAIPPWLLVFVEPVLRLSITIRKLLFILSLFYNSTIRNIKVRLSENRFKNNYYKWSHSVNITQSRYIYLKYIIQKWWAKNCTVRVRYSKNNSRGGQGPKKPMV